MLEHSIGKSLVESYLHQPYAWFLNRNSANLGQNILSEVGVVVNGIIAPVLVIITSGLVFFAIITLLILINISVALSISLFFITSYLIIFYLVKKFLSHIGKERLQANQNRFRTLSETFGAIKEIKVCGLEQFHIHRFEIPSKKTATTAAFLTLVANLPRYLIEILTFGGLIFFIWDIVKFKSVKSNPFILLLFMTSKFESLNISFKFLPKNPFPPKIKIFFISLPNLYKSLT
jgi:ABC-type multidrug transport system fused ATPase/permease subunit